MATPVVLVLVGLWTIAGSSFLGFSAEWASTILRVLIGILFVFVAALMVQTNSARRETGEVYQALNMLLYGKNYRRDREAIRILLKALPSKDMDVSINAWKNLKELTGQNFARDAQVWESWWVANEKRFALKAKRPKE
jgi:hypothetical protein